MCFFVADGKPPAAPSGIHASETDRTYVVLSWKAPAYSSRAPMWYYIEKVTNSVILSPLLLSVIQCAYYMDVHFISVRMHVLLCLNAPPCSSEAAAFVIMDVLTFL